MACMTLIEVARAQDTFTVSYHIGNSRTLDYMAAGDSFPPDSALEDLATLAGVERQVVAYHLNWGQPLKNILLNPPGNLTGGGIVRGGRWDSFIGGRLKIDQFVVQPFWQPFSMLGKDGRTVFEPATLASDVDAIGHWLSLIPEADDTRLYIAGVSPTLAYQTIDAAGELIDPTTDWLENTQWEAPFDPAIDDRVVTTAAYYDALFQEVSPITDRKVSVIPSGRVFKELYDRGYNVLDLYTDDLHINPAGELVESLTVAAVMFKLDPYDVSFAELPLSKYNHPLVNPAFFELVQSAVRDVVNGYEYDFVAFVPEPSGTLLCLGAIAGGLGAMPRAWGRSKA
jgi:hypothetical protein